MAEKTTDTTISNEYCHAKDLKEFIKNERIFMAVSLKNIAEAFKEKRYVNPSDKLSAIYYSHLPVISRDAPNKLFPHRSSYHRITLKPGTEPLGVLFTVCREKN